MVGRKQCGRGGVGLLMAVATSLLVAGVAWPRVDSGTTTPAPGAKPHCYPQMPGPVVGSQRDPSQDLCGSNKNDKLLSKWGHTVETFGGDDTICAFNGVGDDIWGGPEGASGDRAYVDAEDVKGARSLAAWGRKHDIEVVTSRYAGWAKKACPKRAGYSSLVQQRPQSGAADPLRGPAYGPIVFCDEGASTPQKWRIWFPYEPQIRAADQGPGTQWQTVAWSAVLYRQQGADWIEDGQTIWLWDRTFEEESKKPFIGHYWRRFTPPRDRRFTYFTPRQPGVYRIEIIYKWYKEPPRAPNYDFQVGDDEHVGPNETDGTHRSCTFPKVTPPPPPPPPTSPTAVVSGREPVRAEPAGLSTRLPRRQLKSATR